jgi:DNA-binding GntR family transcriptional regulator
MIGPRPTTMIVTSSLADEIAFRLQAAILDGTYPPGTHLLQDELCARFGVSRTPVREALRKLQAQHLIVIMPNRCATVRVPSREELIEVYAVRGELEGFACELAAARMGPKTFALLETAQAAIDAAAAEALANSEGDASLHARFSSANDDFHRAIHDAAANARLKRIIDDLQGFFPKNVVWRAMRSSEEFREVNCDEHERIRAALERGDGRRARREMGAHIRHARAVLLAYLDEHVFWG